MFSSVDPGAVAVLALSAGLYLYALARLRARGVGISRWQQLAWWTGLACFAIALIGPLDHLADDLFSAHMGQHLLFAEVGAPLILVGIRSPVLLFMLPPAALKSLARRRRLRALLGFLSRPLVAIPLYVLVLYAWHLEFMFVGALESEPLHLLQHWSFIAISLLVWWSALEPNRRRMRGELWKVGYIFGARLGGMMLGMAFLVMRSPAYEAFYGQRAHEHGLTPIADQQIGGGLMLTLDAVIVFAALCFFFWRASEDDLEAQRKAAASG